ncbi:PTS fructose transporter subunit IIA, partial [Streptomyces cavourensis]|nr:PTS fructose transporter subunit IIA [Streptomyces cavourensis]
MSEAAQVGIVLVSHSGPVAESVAELARGLAAGGVTAGSRPTWQFCHVEDLVTA